jgi:hypothetical protein
MDSSNLFEEYLNYLSLDKPYSFEKHLRNTHKKPRGKTRALNKPALMLPCDYCGKLHKKPQSHLHNHFFCNKSCEKQWRTGKSQKEIREKPELIGNTPKTVWKAKISNSNSGYKSSTWKGGISFEPYCPLFNKIFREKVRSFFGRKCIECGKLEINNFIGSRKNYTLLAVHHVSYDKKTCCKEGELVNDRQFVVLCNSCHTKTNFNRTYWTQHFKEIISSKFNGKCY